MNKHYVGLEAFSTPNKIDDIDSLMKKIQMHRDHFELKEWMEEYYVADTVVPSPLDFTACFRLALSWKAEQAMKDHPSSIVSTHLELNDVSISVDSAKVTSVDKETGDKKEINLDCKQSYYVQDKDFDRVVINAQASDYLAYGCRILKDYSISDSFSMKNCNFLSVPYCIYTDMMAKFLSFLKAYSGGGVRSPCLVRDALYTNFDRKGGMSVYTWALFNERTKSGELSSRVEGIVKKYQAKYDGLPPCKGFTHVTQTLDYPGCSDVNKLFKLFNAHTQFRGAGSGLGSLTASYYFNSLSQSLAKALTVVLEILEICRAMTVAVVKTDPGLLTEYEKRVLINNGIAVIDGSIGPCLTAGDPIGIYGSTKLPCIYFTAKKGVYPVVEEKELKHKWEPKHLISLIPETRHFMLRVVMHPDLGKVVEDFNKSQILNDGRQLYFHPVYTPAKPEVFLTDMKVYKTPITFEELIQRSAKAIYYRTMYPFNKLPFIKVDPYSPTYFDKIPVLLVRRGGKVEEKTVAKTLAQAIVDSGNKREVMEVSDAYDFVDLEDEEEKIPMQSILREEDVLIKIREELSEIERVRSGNMKDTLVYGVVAAYCTENWSLAPIDSRILAKKMTYENFKTYFAAYIGIISEIELQIKKNFGSREMPIISVAKKSEPPPVTVVKTEDLDLGDDEDFSAAFVSSMKSRKKKKDGDT